jgi:CheY-like chemotaxis protein
MDAQTAAGRLEDVSILIVDDDQDVRESFEAALLAEGAEVESVDNGNDAVDICQSDDVPELVVLDMMLPGRSGFLALEKIKGRETSPSVIMVTANEGRRHQEYAEALGVDAYLIKPVPLETLISIAAELSVKRRGV